MPEDDDWLVVGDFNLLRKPMDRNREGADLNKKNCLMKQLIS